jgi:hypothetical protein
VDVTNDERNRDRVCRGDKVRAQMVVDVLNKKLNAKDISGPLLVVIAITVLIAEQQPPAMIRIFRAD